MVGAGLAGLTCARRLAEAGVEVAVVDKGRSVGGRLATRRIGDATLDHGAQFFTVRGDAFAETVRHAVAAGVVAEWCRGFGDTPDGFPRYRAEGGMNRWAKWLAEGLPVATGVELTSLQATTEGWVARHGRGEYRAPVVVSTAPVPQTLALLERGGTALPSAVAERLGSIEYHLTLALLVHLGGPSAVPAPGGVQLDDGPFGFIADNRAKGISGAHAVTFHAAHALSAERFDDDPDTVRHHLLELAAPWLGDAEVVGAQLKKWRYAGPVRTDPDPCVTVELAGATLVAAGDAFAGPKVEGAFNSGRAAAEAVLVARGSPT